MNPMKDTSSDILIVGSGFAGLTAAINLKRLNIPFRIFEASPAATNIGGSVTIFPNGMRIFRDLGLREKVIESGVTITKAHFQDHNGRFIVLRSMGQEHIYAEPTITIRRALLNALLLEKAQELGIQVEYGKKFVSLEKHDDQVVVSFQDATKVRGRCLIGADGTHSLVREFVLENKFTPKYSKLVFWGGFVSDQSIVSKLQLDPNTQYVSVGPVGFFGYGYVDNVKKSEPSLLWYCYLRQEDRLSRQELDRYTDQEIIDKVLASHENWHEPVRTLIKNSTSFCRASVSDVLDLPQWSNGRVIIIGDAAHAMNPVSGQGASTAMEDAMILTDLLKDYTGDYQDLFRTFEAARKERVHKIAKKARESSRMTMLKVGPVIGWIRNKTFAIVTKVIPESVANWAFTYDVKKVAKDLRSH